MFLCVRETQRESVCVCVCVCACVCVCVARGGGGGGILPSMGITSTSVKEIDNKQTHTKTFMARNINAAARIV